jgi:hypothetical protein
VASGLLAALCVSLPTAAQGAIFESIHSYDVDIQIQTNGDLAIVETIDYDFGTEPHHGIFRDIPTRLRYDDRYDRVFPLRVDDVSGSADTPVNYTLEDAGDGMTRIKIGDPDRTITGEHTYRIAYTVQGAMNAFASHDELYWNAIGDEWTTVIDRATVRVYSPGAVTAVGCYAGAEGSRLPCDATAAHGSTARFAQDQLFPYEGLTVVVAIEKGAVAVAPPILEERWSVGRAFRVNDRTLSAAVAVLLLGCGAFGYAVWTRPSLPRLTGRPGHGQPARRLPARPDRGGRHFGTGGVRAARGHQARAGRDAGG